MTRIIEWSNHRREREWSNETRQWPFEQNTSVNILEFYQNFAEKNDKSSYLKVPMLQFSIFNCNAFRSGFIEAVMISRNVLKGSEFNCLIRSESGLIILILIREQTGQGKYQNFGQGQRDTRGGAGDQNHEHCIDAFHELG